MQKKFEGILPALVTPFKEDNKTINEDMARKVIDFEMSQGADGFYVLGGTGEGLVMGREEREIMAQVAVSHVNHRVPVIIHIASMNLNEAIALAKHAEKIGADAVAAVPPCFFAYSEEDLYQYYKKLASAVSIPVIIYYHPGAQKVMSPELISRIFTVDNVTGVKWSAGDLFSMMRLKDLTQGDMNIINGPDELLCCGLMAGADAGIGSTYNVMLPEFKEVYRLVKAGKVEEARAVQLKINRVIYKIIRHETVPAVKAAVKMLGYDCGTATFPLRQIVEPEYSALQKELAEVGFPFRH